MEKNVDLKSSSCKQDENILNSRCLDDLQKELTQKLQELNEITQNSKHLISELEHTMHDSSYSNDKTAENKIKSAKEQGVIDKLNVLVTLPKWLNSLHDSIDEFLEIAKSLQPNIKTDEIKAENTPFDPKIHKERREKYMKLMAHQNQKINELIEKEGNHIVNTLVDISILYAECSNTNKGAISDKLKTECSVLFEKDLPIHSIAECLEDLLDSDYVRNVPPEHLHREVQRQCTLNELQIQEYLNSRQSSHVLGHIVHRLLGIKYPRPLPPPGIGVPRMPVMALLLGLNDAEAMGNLHDMLVQQQVMLVLFEDALESCIEAYRREGPGLPRLESKDPPQPEEEPPSISAVDQLLPHALLGDRIQGRPKPTHFDRETQTGPEIIPTLSLAASLGKQALETLRLNEDLSDWLMVAIMIEYLKLISKPGTGGWVLADFPSTFEQVSLFETAISGYYVPNPDKKENLSGVTLHQSRIVCDPSVPPGYLQPFKTVFTSVVSTLHTEPPQDPEMLDYVSLVQELYMQQGRHYCFHCIRWIPENIAALTEILLSLPPDESSTPSIARTESSSENVTLEYADMSISPDFAVGLASVWESLEIAYISSLHRIFLTQRAHDKDVGKFINTMKCEFVEFLTRANSMQKVIDEFQKRHHELPRSRLGELDVKSELKKRIVDLQKHLSELADLKCNEAKSELVRIASEPWLSRELGERLNIASSMIQLELDRYIDTIALLQDYFCASLDRIPPDTSKSLRFDVPKALTAEVTDEWAPLMVESLTSDSPPEFIPEPCLTYLNSMLEGAKTHIEKLFGAINTSITKLESEFKPKPAASKKTQVVAKAKGKKKAPDLTDVPPLEDTEALRLTSLRLQLLQEWRSVCESETEETIKRLKETCGMTFSETKELIKQIWLNSYSVAHTAYEAQFNSDSHSAATLCEFLGMAIEAEASLENALVFPRKTQYLQYLKQPCFISASAPVPYNPDLSDRLHGLVNILQRVAPDGIILRPALIYILQQASVSELLPSDWKNLNSQGISQLVEQVVVSEKADWRIFIIQLLDLPVATQRQLLMAKKRFNQFDAMNRGLIFKKNFSQTHFWIEESYKKKLISEKVKNIIFNIFRHPSREFTNYIDMLLACSHDENPVLGFAKACAVYSGSLVKTGFDATDNGDGELDLLLSEVNAGFPVATEITLEVAKAVILAGRPFNEEERTSLQVSLESLFKEVEEESLTAQERRARQREAVANKASNAPPKERQVTTVLSSFLLRNPRLLNIIPPTCKTIHFSTLIENFK